MLPLGLNVYTSITVIMYVFYTSQLFVLRELLVSPGRWMIQYQSNSPSIKLCHVSTHALMSSVIL